MGSCSLGLASCGSGSTTRLTGRAGGYHKNAAARDLPGSAGVLAGSFSPARPAGTPALPGKNHLELAGGEPIEAKDIPGVLVAGEEERGGVVGEGVSGDVRGEQLGRGLGG